MFVHYRGVVLETLNNLNGIHFSPQPILKIIIWTIINTILLVVFIVWNLCHLQLSTINRKHKDLCNKLASDILIIIILKIYFDNTG